VIDENDLQHKKHSDSRISTLFGIKIDGSDEPENPSDSIRDKREFGSNIIELSGITFVRSYRSTHRSQFRKIIEFGIQIRAISVFVSAQSVTVLIEPLLTTTRRL
jgi:hypothetical protein